MPNQSVLEKFFAFVEYNGFAFPVDYKANLCEVAAHFDKDTINPSGPYSLHTEYSYGKRNFSSSLISNYPALVEAHKSYVPQLWKSEEWAVAFANFLIDLTKEKAPPSIIEIHPPFNDYCTADMFSERFQAFEKHVHTVYPEVLILIENRAGTVYRGGKFLFGTAKEIVSLCDLIKRDKLCLGIVLDFPQLLTAERIDPINFNVPKYQLAIHSISEYQSMIKGIHIWGKKKSTTGRWVAHSGTLNTYFGGDDTTKEAFLSGIRKICSDGQSRFLVPEVNSNEDDLSSIIKDLEHCFYLQ